MVKKQDSVSKKVNYLICVNNDNYSEVALHFACSMAKQNDGSVIMLHVIEPADYQTIGSVAEKMREEQIQEAEKLMNKLALKVQKWSQITPVFIVKHGVIESEIISLIEEDRSINMLVVGTAADTSTKSKTLPPLVASLGSKLKIPMLIVPGSLTKKQIENTTQL